MKLLILSLLVLTSLCLVLADEEPQPNFDDFAANDGDMPDDAPDDYVEDEEDNYMEDDEDYVPEPEQDDSEPRDPDGFKDDDDSNGTGGNKGQGGRPNLVDPIVEETPPPKPGEEGSASGEPNKTNQSDEPDLKDALRNKLGLNPEDDPEFTKK